MDVTAIVDAVGWPWLAVMVVFFAFTVWWGFGGHRNDKRDDKGPDE